MSEKQTSHNYETNGLLARFLLSQESEASPSKNSFEFAQKFAVEHSDLLDIPRLNSAKGAALICDFPLDGERTGKLEFDTSYKGVYVWQLSAENEQYDLITDSKGNTFATHYVLTQGTVMKRTTIQDGQLLDGLQDVVEKAVSSDQFRDTVEELRQVRADAQTEYAKALGKRILSNPNWEKTKLFHKSDAADAAASKIFNAGFAAGARSKRAIRPLLYANDWRPVPLYDSEYKGECT